MFPVACAFCVGRGRGAPRVVFVYILFLKILTFSISVIYWNPCSIRVVASLIVDAVLTFHSFSSPLFNRCV